jgi:hypothetical protein
MKFSIYQESRRGTRPGNRTDLSEAESERAIAGIRNVIRRHAEK